MQKSAKTAISATDAGKSFGSFSVLRNIDLVLRQGEKVALVGPNGIGKTTLLRMLKGEIEPDSGKVTRAKGSTIGYIPQDFKELYGLTVKEFAGGADLAKLSLDRSILDRKIGELSGGEKTKVALLRIFLASEDVLLLDEPTNNLDVEALAVLEAFVKESRKTFLIISHDRAFLDAVVTRVFEIDEFERNLHAYEGNYSSYQEERAARIKRQWSAYEDAAARQEHVEEVVKEKLKRADAIKRKPAPDKDKMQTNFKIERSTKAFQRGAKFLKDKLESQEEIPRPKNLLPLNLSFETAERGGDKAFIMKGVAKQLPEFTLGPIDLEIAYGDRILIEGSNGAGKTTLIKLMLGMEKPDAGEIVRGTGLETGFLPQEERFLSEMTVKEAFLEQVPIEESLARKTLNRFRLEAEDMDKKISELSSGERSRLILAMLMGRKANCLILDEPTNHLDLEVLESLEKALREFKGTLIAVSHDRHFMEKIDFTRKIRLEKGKLS